MQRVAWLVLSLLLAPVQARLGFGGELLESVRPVDRHGVPRDEEVERSGNTITIDGWYATYYHEVRRETGGDASTLPWALALRGAALRRRRRC